MMEDTGMQQWNKGPRSKTVTTSEEAEDIRQDLQEDRRAGDRKAIVGSSNGLRERSDWALWRGRHPPKQKKRLQKQSPPEQSIIQQQLLSNDSANKHVSTATRERSNNGRDVFYEVRAEIL
jgi:hypothetical protein